jgi:hypothetical protein
MQTLILFLFLLKINLQISILVADSKSVLSFFLRLQVPEKTLKTLEKAVKWSNSNESQQKIKKAINNNLYNL